jgi:hypothetical protein
MLDAMLTKSLHHGRSVLGHSNLLTTRPSAYPCARDAARGVNSAQKLQWLPTKARVGTSVDEVRVQEENKESLCIRVFILSPSALF